MDPVDSIKRLLSGVLPQNHLVIVLGLAALLIIITHDNDLAGSPLTPRRAVTAPVVAGPSAVSEALVPPETALPGTPAADPVPARATMESTAIATAGEPPAAEVSAPAPDYVTEVKQGDNLSLIFARAGLTPQTVYKVSHSGPEAAILSNLYPGYRLEFKLTDGGELNSLTVFKNRLESYSFTLNDRAGFTAAHDVRTPAIKQVYREAVIDDSLFMAAKRGGISAGVTMELADIFGSVIDFLLDTRQGDTFNLLYEEKYLGGEYIGNGAILAAQFTNQGDTYSAIRYVDSRGKAGFYSPDGENMRRMFLRNPVDFTRISDGFNLHRKHPILHTIRAHKGTDYAAPRGTPVVATSDGRVTWAGRYGSFGNLIVLQHGERFQTKYAHLNGYAKGIKKGAHVKQGQVIGYVGATGGATGPHLHYEFLLDGVHRNSRTILDKLPKADPVPEAEMQHFREQAQILLSQLDSYSSNIRNIAQHTVTDSH